MEPTTAILALGAMDARDSLHALAQRIEQTADSREAHRALLAT